mgnify:CR=1 FL=1
MLESPQTNDQPYHNGQVRCRPITAFAEPVLDVIHLRSTLTAVDVFASWQIESWDFELMILGSSLAL